ncbi:hypothetical protein BU26DRAFT_552916 [Trematosphaeria pertusa]|uniref:Actin-like ATPase domain-containing protein n=1 Tax=Trematosphaeria pertusa TaxID=390896 RepID=A0A6A6I753_9PLEO|nr:uncharacterized protein BU26DRAFT_552916 [Trematosphaeria pertusa]KAF2245898.1 hypothetical protein BU26DRAFT_552916 [Trematosphaeria pertusa]
MPSTPTNRLVVGLDYGTTFTAIRLPPPLHDINDAKRGIEDGHLELSGDDLKHLFDPCIEQTLALINGQIQTIKRTGSQVKYVFLVGGFGMSKYMFDRVRAFTLAQGITTIHPPHPWSAIARGAVAKGLETDIDLVFLRKCRRHYGTPCSQLFDDEEHDEQDAYRDQYDGRKMARGQMNWLINKGDALLSRQPLHAHIDVHTEFWLDEAKIFTALLTACDDDVPPKRFADDAVYKVVSLTADVSTVPESMFQFCKPGPGRKPFLRLDFDINISLTSSLRFWVTVDGQEYGSVEARYE